MTDGVWFDLSRPTDNERNAQPSFIEVSLTPSKSSSCARVDIGPKKTVRVPVVEKIGLAPVVTAHKHDGVLVDLELLQQREDLADLTIAPLDHRRVHLCVPLPALIAGVPLLVFVSLPFGQVFR